jgi:hypothetical protein
VIGYEIIWVFGWVFVWLPGTLARGNFGGTGHRHGPHRPARKRRADAAKSRTDRVAGCARCATGDEEKRAFPLVPPRIHEGIRHWGGGNGRSHRRSVAQTSHRRGVGKTPASMGADRGWVGGTTGERLRRSSAEEGRFRTKTMPLAGRVTRPGARQRRPLAGSAIATGILAQSRRPWGTMTGTRLRRLGPAATPG